MVSSRKLILWAEQGKKITNWPFPKGSSRNKKIFKLLEDGTPNTFKAIFILGFRNYFTFPFNLKCF